jgi:hypothetical protein
MEIALKPDGRSIPTPIYERLGIRDAGNGAVATSVVQAMTGYNGATESRWV